MTKKLSKSAQKRYDQHLNRLINDKISIEEASKEKVDAINNDPDLHKNIISDYDKTREKDLLDKFSEELQKREPIIELFDIKNINMKANISEEQRNILVVLLSAYEQALSFSVNIKCIPDICKRYIELSPSIAGKRSEQYVDAHKASLQQFNNPNNQMGSQYGNYSPQMQQMRK